MGVTMAAIGGAIAAGAGTAVNVGAGAIAAGAGGIATAAGAAAPYLGAAQAGLGALGSVAGVAGGLNSLMGGGAKAVGNALQGLHGAGGSGGGLLDNPFAGGVRSLAKLLPSIVGSPKQGMGLFRGTAQDAVPGQQQQPVPATPGMIDPEVYRNRQMGGPTGGPGPVEEAAQRVGSVLNPDGLSGTEFFEELGTGLAFNAMQQKEREREDERLKAVLAARQGTRPSVAFQPLAPDPLGGLGALAAGR
jgi:hypothetical protein